eukprot:Gb_00252 [translate_table: standard]
MPHLPWSRKGEFECQSGHSEGAVEKEESREGETKWEKRKETKKEERGNSGGKAGDENLIVGKSSNMRQHVECALESIIYNNVIICIVFVTPVMAFINRRTLFS